MNEFSYVERNVSPYFIDGNVGDTLYLHLYIDQHLQITNHVSK